MVRVPLAIALTSLNAKGNYVLKQEAKIPESAFDGIRDEKYLYKLETTRGMMFLTAKAKQLADMHEKELLDFLETDDARAERRLLEKDYHDEVRRRTATYNYGTKVQNSFPKRRSS